MDPYNLIKNFPFALESRLARDFNERFGRRPTSSPFLSGDTYRTLAQHRHDQVEKITDPERVMAGDIVFVSSWFLEEFEIQLLPRIRHRFVLVTHQGDVNVGEKHRSLAENPLLFHWFAQNVELVHDKVTPLPIGLEDQRCHESGLKGDFQSLRHRRDFETAPRAAKIVRAFTLGTNPEARFLCYRALHRRPTVVDFWQPLNARRYRKELIRYQFVASPEGNGMDCHRTWEALYLRVVPVVTPSPAVSWFQKLGLPLVVVDDWAQVAGWSSEQMTRLYGELSPGFDHPALWFPWWKDRILSAAAQAAAE